MNKFSQQLQNRLNIRLCFSMVLNTLYIHPQFNEKDNG